MSSIYCIYKNNRNTFYDFESGKLLPIRKQYGVKLFFAVILTIIFFQISSGLISAVLTVYAILTGFSFNVILYLIANPNKVDTETASIENELTVTKLKKLRKELVFNVSYFNTISLLIIVISLFYFLIDIRTHEAFMIFLEEDYLKDLLKSNADKITSFMKFGAFVYAFLLYSFIIESIHTFTRTIVRVNFYFNKQATLTGDN